MSVDWYTCVVCGDLWTYCGEYTHCASCGEMIGPCCMDKMFKKYGVADDQDTLDEYGEECPKECDACTKTIIRDADVLKWALAKIGVSMKEAKKRIKAGRAIQTGTTKKRGRR